MPAARASAAGMQRAARGRDRDRVRDRAPFRQNTELRRANEILKPASAFFAAALDRPHPHS